MQIGNSVPPLLGRAIAEVIKNYLWWGEEYDI
jgi:site-specific DNA-cytosine methylase